MTAPQEQFNFDDERVARIKASVKPLEAGGPERPNSLDGQFNETEIPVHEGKISFEGARRVSASRSPDPKTRLLAATQDLQPELPPPADRPPKRSRPERNPQYYDEEGSIRNSRLSSKEKGMADSAPQHIREQFRKY